MKRIAIITIAEDTEEMRSLLDTLGYSVVKEYLQKRNHPHKVGFLGPGRIEEIAEEVKELELDMIVVNGSLKPSQHHYLEMLFQMECMDRPGVILRIFADHAHTPEAIAQVTLAKLRYELPFLREWIHKAKSGDRPGFLAGGAYATDVYFEHAKTHARAIEQSLVDLSRQREITRSKRHAKGYSLVSLAGYTNAGKSALMNALCESQVEVDNRLFSTLSTTTRRIAGARSNVLITDTVGFIRDLPPDLVDAFNSTLEEIFYADLILLVLDVSESLESMKSKLKTSIEILEPKVDKHSVIVVGNKVDLISKDARATIEQTIRSVEGACEIMFVSAKDGTGLNPLRERIVRVQGYDRKIEVTLPLTDQAYSLMSSLRSVAKVETEVVKNHLKGELWCKPEDVDKITQRLRKAGAHVLKARETQGGPPS
ncbi:MAG: GTPase HflX [Thermoplasmata archaeon]|jgi:GTP-binding protein HflX|nr:GTPase HflX [Thermoplasmata archaeon]